MAAPAAAKAAAAIAAAAAAAVAAATAVAVAKLNFAVAATRVARRSQQRLALDCCSRAGCMLAVDANTAGDAVHKSGGDREVVLKPRKCFTCSAAACAHALAASKLIARKRECRRQRGATASCSRPCREQVTYCKACSQGHGRGCSLPRAVILSACQVRSFVGYSILVSLPLTGLNQSMSVLSAADHETEVCFVFEDVDVATVLYMHPGSLSWCNGCVPCRGLQTSTHVCCKRSFAGGMLCYNAAHNVRDMEFLCCAEAAAAAMGLAGAHHLRRARPRDWPSTCSSCACTARCATRLRFHQSRPS